MKLKYYLRGLGIGILVTTVILSLAGVGRKNMTDEEVVKRAKELGKHSAFRPAGPDKNG